jgi:hypothetical protein
VCEKYVLNHQSSGAQTFIDGLVGVKNVVLRS